MQAANTYNTQTYSKAAQTQSTRQTDGRTRRTAKTKAHTLYNQKHEETRLRWINADAPGGSLVKKCCYSVQTKVKVKMRLGDVSVLRVITDIINASIQAL